MATLISLANWRKLHPRHQAFLAYMQSDLPGSELKGHDKNPYMRGTPDWDAWEAGMALAVQEAQDSGYPELSVLND